MNNVINRIERRARVEVPQARSNQLISAKSRIPKTPQYYSNLANEAQRLGEPYFRSVYLRCAALARLGNKQREINRLLHIANETVAKRRNPAPVVPARAPARRKYNLRSDNRRLAELYTVRNLKDFIVDYAQKIKHKKEILYNFLRKEYDSGRKYIPSSRKFAKIKVRNRNRA